MMPARRYFGAVGVRRDILQYHIKPPNSACWVSGKKDERSVNDKTSRCRDEMKCEVAIPAVPLRCVPEIDVDAELNEPELSLEEYIDEVNHKAKTTGNTAPANDDWWNHESEKLAAVIAEAKEFIIQLDTNHSMAEELPVMDYLRESRDQPTFLDSDAFPQHTSIDQKTESIKLGKRERGKVLTEFVMLRDKDGSVSGKRLKGNIGISMVQEEKTIVNETLLEDEDEVCVLSPAEWEASQQRFNRKKCEFVEPSIGMFEKNVERQSSLNVAREFQVDTQPEGTNFDGHVNTLPVVSKSDQPIVRFRNRELSKFVQLDCSSDSDESSEGEQVEAAKMFSVDDETSAQWDHEELVNLAIVQHDHPQGRKVVEALKLFQKEYIKAFHDHELELREHKITKGPHYVAAERVKAMRMNLSTGKPFGHVPGVEIGDEFSFRAELAIVGLNRQFCKGIDYVNLNGVLYATSVVDSGRYNNEAKVDDILIYSGQGGNPNVSSKGASMDQKLEMGNLALSNSMKMGFPVRVIQKRKRLMYSKSLGVNDKRDYVYVYDGLYKVNRYWHQRDDTNYKMVYKFELQRLPGQPRVHSTRVEYKKRIHAMELPKENLEGDNQAMEVRDSLQEKENYEVGDWMPSRQMNHGTDVKSGKQSRAMDICVLDDVSKGKEIFKVRAVNGVDNELPPPFTYITNIVYPSWTWMSVPIGCDCTDGCSDSVQCRCVIKNGGEIPYNEKGKLMKAMIHKAVHECGPSCKCPPSCTNRVSQHGPCFQLEIFKTKSMGWGVRSRDYIMPGSFICEYIGELLGEAEAEERITNDQYLFDVCHGKSKEDDFALDASKCGNIGRFINHSCDPNVFAQKVIYDHDDMRMPHIMFFAGKRIPPGQELRYDYNYTKTQVLDANGNIRTKACYCGSSGCTGRLY